LRSRGAVDDERAGAVPGFDGSFQLQNAQRLANGHERDAVLFGQRRRRRQLLARTIRAVGNAIADRACNRKVFQGLLKRVGHEQ